MPKPQIFPPADISRRLPPKSCVTCVPCGRPPGSGSAKGAASTRRRHAQRGMRRHACMPHSAARAQARGRAVGSVKNSCFSSTTVASAAVRSSSLQCSTCSITTRPAPCGPCAIRHCSPSGTLGRLRRVRMSMGCSSVLARVGDGRTEHVVALLHKRRTQQQRTRARRPHRCRCIDTAADPCASPSPQGAQRGTASSRGAWPGGSASPAKRQHCCQPVPNPAIEQPSRHGKGLSP